MPHLPDLKDLGSFGSWRRARPIFEAQSGVAVLVCFMVSPLGAMTIEVTSKDTTLASVGEIFKDEGGFWRLVHVYHKDSIDFDSNPF